MDGEEEDAGRATGREGLKVERFGKDHDGTGVSGKGVARAGMSIISARRSPCDEAGSSDSSVAIIVVGKGQ